MKARLPSTQHSALSTQHYSPSSPSLVYVLGYGIAQLFGLLFGERAGDGAAVLKAYDRDAAVHLEVEGEAAAVVQLEDERGRDAGGAVGFKWHLSGFSVRFKGWCGAGSSRGTLSLTVALQGPRGGASLPRARRSRS